MRGGAKHPPKKKHAKKPRPDPVVEMSARDREIKAKQEFQKAKVHLEEAVRLARWGEAPNACVHSAYYAMHHCAAAAILASGGVGKRKDVPQSHEHVIQHYGNLVASEPGILGRSGMLLSRARTDRMVADYNLVQNVTNEAAEATVKDAQEFVKACQAKWNF
jgi:uncharacterized protein (UPF0332 family)